MQEKTSGWKEKVDAFRARARPLLLKARVLLGLYLDDLLTLGAGGCFTAAAVELGGRPAGLLTAGACLLGYAVVIARARRGGGGK